MTDLPTLFRAAWDRWDAAIARSADPIGTFASWGPEGPQMRSVVLRGSDRDAGSLSFYTDLFSSKVAELRADPRAGMHIYDPGQRLHLRATGLATLRSGAELAAIWDGMSLREQAQYGMTPPPGRQIDAGDAYMRGSAFEAFAEITLTLTSMDVVRLKEPHRRARYERVDGWAGVWLAP